MGLAGFFRPQWYGGGLEAFDRPRATTIPKPMKGPDPNPPAYEDLCDVSSS
jgi:hypothetical protein